MPLLVIICPGSAFRMAPGPRVTSYPFMASLKQLKSCHCTPRKSMTSFINVVEGTQGSSEPMCPLFLK
eukprot:1161678-Pelagomonas_calceolata.AAC.6